MTSQRARFLAVWNSFAVILLISPGLTTAQSQSQTQNQKLQGGVQQNEAPFVDIIEAGNNNSAVADRNGGVYCDWMQGACNMLHAYVAFVSQGGTARSDCLGPMEYGVELERQEQALKGSQSYQLDQEKNSLEQRRDRVLAQVPHDCFAAQPRSNVPSNDTSGKPRPYPQRPQGNQQSYYRQPQPNFSGNGLPDWIKPPQVNSPDDIPIGPFEVPPYLKPLTKPVERGVREVFQQVPDSMQLGPDYPRYEQLKARYNIDRAKTQGFQQEIQGIRLIPRNQYTAGLIDHQLVSLSTDLRLNNADMHNIRTQAMQILQKAGRNNPGMVPDNGLQTRLNFDFPQ